MDAVSVTCISCGAVQYLVDRQCRLSVLLRRAVSDLPPFSSLWAPKSLLPLLLDFAKAYHTRCFDGDGNGAHRANNTVFFASLFIERSFFTFPLVVFPSFVGVFLCGLLIFFYSFLGRTSAVSSVSFFIRLGIEVLRIREPPGPLPLFFIGEGDQGLTCCRCICFIQLELNGELDADLRLVVTGWFVFERSGRFCSRVKEAPRLRI